MNYKIINLANNINKISAGLPQINIMEVCGTHTMAIGKNSLRQILPSSINLISGPGCPVCVTSASDIDSIIELAEEHKNYIFSFGDMLKVPGSKTSLYKKRSEGANVKLCYSPADALDFAVNNPEINVIFVAIGFETTAPLTAVLIKRAFQNNIGNFFIYNTHKLVPPAIEFLLASESKNNIHAFLCPGHVCAITGSRPFDLIARNFQKPSVISGFSPEDILESIYMILKQIVDNKASAEIQYKWVVKEEGNKAALKYIDEVFEAGSSYWRGIGIIENSGLILKDEFKGFDAKKKFRIKDKNIPEPKSCSCGDILQGKKKPFECLLFGNKCIPDRPVGPCMVSSEGTCAAYFKYEIHKTKKL
jgi:hydrogenase expression/formation protein HypD